MKKTTWGGARARAGRKRVAGRRRRVKHERREEFAKLTPVHVTVRLVDGHPTLRSPVALAALERAFAAGRERFGFRLVHFAAMTTHLHMIVEAENSTALRRGMQGLLVRIARGLNTALMRRGKVFADRFHARVITCLVGLKRALLYVLCNARRHGIAFTGPFDPYSSAAWFHGWCGDYGRPHHEPPVASAKSWQIIDGFLLYGRLDPLATPGPRA